MKSNASQTFGHRNRIIRREVRNWDLKAGAQICMAGGGTKGKMKMSSLWQDFGYTELPLTSEEDMRR